MHIVDTQVRNPSYDPATGRFGADVVFLGARGLRQIRAEVPGHPAWGRARVAAALVAAARAAGGAPPDP